MRLSLKTAALLATGLAILLLALCAGTSFIPPGKVIAIMSGLDQSAERGIVMGLRLPRALMALVIGASLAVSGTLFQALLRNPLSDPYTIGVSAGAAFGSTVAVIAGTSHAWIVLGAFAGGIAATMLVYALARRLRLGSTALILGGISLGFILSSCVLLLFAVSRAEEVHKALLWLMGDLSIARYRLLGRVAVLSLLLLAMSFFYSRHLNILSFGESFAANLGVERGAVNNIFWIASLLSAVSVSLGGVIGFVGLIVPHAMRALVGPDHRALLASSALGGGFFLLLCDTLGRSLAPPFEIPVGIITGIAGGIFFLALLVRKGGFGR